MNKKMQVANKRYTPPKNASKKYYRKFLRLKLFPKGLTKYFD